MTRSQIHLVAWTLVMVVQIVHGQIADRRIARGPNDPPPRKHYRPLAHVLVAAVIAAVIGWICEGFGWVAD